MSKADRVVWCDRGWQPLHYGFCPSEKAWDRQCRKMGSRLPYPDFDAGATIFRDISGGGDCMIVTIAQVGKRPLGEVVGLLVHEATHVWQHVRAAMREKEPSPEFESYAMQAISQGLIQAYAETRGLPRMKG